MCCLIWTIVIFLDSSFHTLSLVILVQGNYLPRPRRVQCDLAHVYKYGSYECVFKLNNKYIHSNCVFHPSWKALVSSVIAALDRQEDLTSQTMMFCYISYCLDTSLIGWSYLYLYMTWHILIYKLSEKNENRQKTL